MDSETLERIKKDMEANRFSEAALTVISLNEGLGLVAEVERLQAEVERLKVYTDPRLFAAASDLLEVAGKGSDEEVDLALVMLTEAVAWWDSLPFDPEKDVKQLPKYEE